MNAPTSKHRAAAPGFRVNFFRPRPGFMSREVLLICVALFAWALVAIGFPICLSITTKDPEAFLASGKTLFGMPLHYWFSGHFLIFWFILICFIFNILIDRLTRNYRKHHQETQWHP